MQKKKTNKQKRPPVAHASCISTGWLLLYFRFVHLRFHPSKWNFYCGGVGDGNEYGGSLGRSHKKYTDDYIIHCWRLTFRCWRMTTERCYKREQPSKAIPVCSVLILKVNIWFYWSLSDRMSMHTAAARCIYKQEPTLLWMRKCVCTQSHADRLTFVQLSGHLKENQNE